VSKTNFHCTFAAPLYKNESWDGNAFLVSWELPTLENGVNVTGIIIRWVDL